jgi:hypothetical protein
MIAHRLEKTTDAEFQYVFDKTYQLLRTTQTQFPSRTIPHNSLAVVKLHKLISKNTETGKPLISIAGSSEDSILTNRFRVIMSSNHQCSSSDAMDNMGNFAQHNPDYFGYSQEDPTLQFDLVLDNCFNRLDSVG